MIGIRIHGNRGVREAGEILSRAAFASGFYVKAFHEPSVERMPFHSVSHIMLDKKPFLTNEPVAEADFLVISELSLAAEALKTAKERSVVVVNSAGKPVIASKKRVKMHYVPAECVPMLGAFAKFFGKVTLKSIKTAAESCGKETLAAIEAGYKNAK